MKYYTADQILNHPFCEMWTSTLQEKHVDLLIERILFFMMDNKELSDKQWGNLIRFCEVIGHDKFFDFFMGFMNEYVFKDHMRNPQATTWMNKMLKLDNKKYITASSQKKYDKLNNKIIKRHAEKTASK